MKNSHGYSFNGLNNTFSSKQKNDSIDSLTILSHNPIQHNYAKGIDLKLNAKLKKREYRLNTSIDNYLDSIND